MSVDPRRASRLCAALALLAGCAPAATAADARPTITTVAAYGERDYAQRRGDCAFGDDAMQLGVREHGLTIANLRFCSSYGHARAELVRDRKARRYLLLETQTGRGTNVARRYLTLYRIGVETTELLRTPLSWPTGPDQRFGYRYEVAPDGAGGLRLRLRGGIERGADAPGPGAAAAERERVIRIECGA
ncbi:hypothetical protein GALL_241670 [mine drainage metagenome]|jgi:hypothetical protein|uniref:Lipoprotein n=1 Tax=mine drainage metagenome TaxID=410659 RepID=A0A1J5RPK9_9ZZZZ